MAVIVKKALVGIRDRYSIEVEHGDRPAAKGSFVDHEYTIECDGDKVAEVSKRCVRIDAYGIEVAPDQDAGADPCHRRLHQG